METFCVVGLALFVGLMFFALFAASRIERSGESMYQRLESIYSTRQLERRDERMEILEEIRAIEKRGESGTRRHRELWAKYNILRVEGERLTAQEQNELVEARGYISDEYADIIEGRR